MLKVDDVNKKIKCKVEKQMIVAGAVKRHGDIVELFFSEAMMLVTSGRVSLVVESPTVESLDRRVAMESKPKLEPAKPKPKAKKIEPHKHDKQRY